MSDARITSAPAAASPAAAAGEKPNFLQLVSAWGGVTIAYRKSRLDSPAYRLNSEESAKASLVKSFEATYISAEAYSVQALAETVGNFDLVYEAVGASQIAFEVMRFLGTNGIFVFTGVPGRKAPIEVDTDLIMRNLVLKNQVVFGTVNAGRETFEASIRDLRIFMQRWPNAVRALITGRYPMEAHRDLLLGRAGGIKNVIQLN